MNPASEPHRVAPAPTAAPGGAPPASLFNMNRGWLLGIGLLLVLAASGFALVIWPQLQLGGLEMVTIEATGQSYPLPRLGEALRGQEVYRANGCQYCHTQQVRAPAAGADLARGWGSRRTVARDYLREAPVMLGTLRLGPDLANLGARQTNALNLLLRLYNPGLVAPGSLMPPHPFLFEQRRLRAGQRISPAALRLPAGNAPRAGYAVVPRAEALALAAYLQSLRAEALFFEVYPAPPLPNPNPTPNAAPSSAPSPRPSPPMGERGDGIR
jgi:cytochrome c oxidase cbb3-type subunit 2